MMLHKRGMSPLMATILLIAFAVSLGAVIMSYGNTHYTDGKQETPLCAGTSLRAYETGGQINLCYDEEEGIIKFTLVNDGSRDISAVQMIASFSLGKVESYDLADSAVTSGHILSVEAEAGKGELAQVQFVASVESGHAKCFMQPITSILPC